MGEDDFWINLRTAARALIPPVPTDLPIPESAYRERLLQSADAWLTPRSVDEFDLRDFSFLEPEDLDRLRRNVEAFREVASQVSEDQPASEQQVQEAMAPFEEIIHLLRPHQFYYFEAFKIQYRLEHALRGKLPPWIESFVCEIGTDVVNDPALFVTLNVSREAADNEFVVTKGRQVRDQVQAAIRRLRLDRWPYISFQSLAELAAAKKGRRR
jgi:hypothetical protein